MSFPQNVRGDGRISERNSCSAVAGSNELGEGIEILSTSVPAGFVTISDHMEKN
jgi:hypothetical protein